MYFFFLASVEMRQSGWLLYIFLLLLPPTLDRWRWAMEHIAVHTAEGWNCFSTLTASRVSISIRRVSVTGINPWQGLRLLSACNKCTSPEYITHTYICTMIYAYTYTRCRNPMTEQDWGAAVGSMSSTWPTYGRQSSPVRRSSHDN